MPAVPLNQIYLFASMDNAPPETRDIINIKFKSFPGRAILFSSGNIILKDIRQSLPWRAAKQKVFANIWKVLITSNVLKYYFQFLLMSMLCTDNLVTGFLYHDFKFSSDVIKTWLHYAQKKMCAARTTESSIKGQVKTSILKVNSPHNFNEFI